MGMVVQHNMNAINSYNKLNANVAGMKKSSEKLSSGYRINRAGDDAAGLAVSEKMRSQIKGLNQAIRNSQDGINMIQTFEGAAQETHSILQRMKELASQSANGTYDNATDRAAIQLEFDQLNDELNQIADTDFNGTIVLNGGQMADGLVQVDGEFNYETASRNAKQLSAADVTIVDQQVFNDVDDAHGRTAADTVWNDLNADWDRKDATKSNGPDSVELTFKFDATSNKWACTGATGGADYTKITVENDGTRNGGFAISTANATKFANVVVDQTALQNGDTVTLKLDNPYGAVSSATNGGAVITTSTLVQGTKDTAKNVDDYNLNVTVADIDDADMTKAINEIYKAFDGASVTFTYTANAALTATNGTLTMADASTAPTSTGVGTTTSGYKYYATIEAGKITISTVNAAGTGKGDDLLTFEASEKGATDNDTAGAITYKVNLENYSFDDSKKPSVSIAAPANAPVSNANSFKNSKARLTYSDNITLQTGARTKDSVNFTFNYNTDKSADMGELKANLNLSARADGLNTENLSLATQDDANYAIDQIDKAINKTSMVRASFGSIQNRLEHKITNLTTTSENLTEAESSIRDTDMASEMMNYTKMNILQQAAQSMLAQANQQPQSILQLLG